MPKVPARSWTRCSSMSRCVPTSPITTRRSSYAWPDALLRLDDPRRFAVEPGADVFDDVWKIFPVILLAYIAEMRRDDDIVHLAARMIERGGLRIDSVHDGPSDRLRIQHGDQRFLVDDRAARRVDEISRLFH